METEKLIIDEEATVGDIMKLIFSSFKIDDRLSDVIIMESYYPLPFCKMQFDKKVWDMPYEEYKEKEENMWDVER
ncbi:MAG: hypothetical protein K6F00_09260 [Lachnospiraceae bacterium]|nr:hypothetical protein [Lachnospiraceae bacterium]